MNTAEKLWVVIVVLFLAGLAGCRPPAKAEEAAAPPAAPPRAKPVVVASAREMVFAEQLVLTGTLEPVAHVAVAARVGGTVDELPVDEGDVVEANKTRLFAIDAVKLKEGVTLAQQQIAVAGAAILEREAGLAQVKTDLQKAKLDYERYKRLLEEDHAVTRNAFELQESRYLQLQAAIKHAETAVDLAREQAKQADTLLAIARKNLADAVVVSPISGVVTTRYVEPGENVSVGAQVVEIQDLSVLEVSVYAPEAAYARVIPGETQMQVRLGEIDAGTHPVSFKSPAVNPGLRTFEVKCRIASPPKGVTAGRLAQTTVILASHHGIGVKTAAILTRRDASVIFVLNGTGAAMKTVRTGLKIGEWTEILDSGLQPETKVVVMGQDFLNDGDAVSVKEEGP